MLTCPDCKASVEEDAIFCDHCGFQLRPLDSPAGGSGAGPARGPAPASNSCPACGYLNPSGEAYCVNCGVQLAGEPAAPPAGEADNQPLSYPAEALRAERRPPSQRICAACGFSNPAGNLFCGNCGTPLNLLQPAPAEPGGPRREAAAAAAQPEQPPRAQIKVCPNCGYPNPPGETACQVCSYRLPGEPTAAGASVSTPLSSPLQTVAGAGGAALITVGRLRATASNTSFAIPARAEVLIGRRDPDKGILPEIDLWQQGPASSSVSRKHARLVVQGGHVYVEDLKSTNATYLNRQRLQPGVRYPLHDGDELQVGGVAMIYHQE